MCVCVCVFVCDCAHVSHDCSSCFQVSLRWAASPTFSDICSPLGSPPRSFTFSLAQFFVLSLFFFMLTRSPIRNAWLTNLSGSVFCVGSHQQTAVDGLSLSCFKLYCLTLQAELIPQVSSQICSSVIFSKNPRCQTEKKHGNDNTGARDVIGVLVEHAAQGLFMISCFKC